MVNAAAVEEFRHTYQQILDGKRIHEYVDIDLSGDSKQSLEETERQIRAWADGTIKLEQTRKGFPLVGALEGGQQLTPMLARIHWTLLEAPASEPWITTDNPVALFEPFPVKDKKEL